MDVEPHVDNRGPFFFIMKKLTIPPPSAETIDWSKPQWVILAGHPINQTCILTNGEHADNVFSGTALPCYQHPDGRYFEGWTKDHFRPLTIDIPFTISNKD